MVSSLIQISHQRGLVFQQHNAQHYTSYHIEFGGAGWLRSVNFY